MDTLDRKNQRILFVDDEEINRVNFEQTFQDDYQVTIAASGEEALEVVRRNGGIAAILADHRMPGMNGAELLARARELAPHAERIIITGYTDPEDIIAAINQGHVYRYILKPWSADELRITIDQAVERFHLKRRNRELMEELRRQNAELEERVLARTAELHAANQTLKARVEELEQTRRELKTLQGLLPICSYCKKIRDDKNSWHQLEEYLSQHAEVLFSHGICPDCYAREVSPELARLHARKRERKD
ncbi:MAG: response regulator [Thermodesulfobacteriota bacterium]